MNPRKVDFARWDELYDASRELLDVIGALKAVVPADEKRDLLEHYERAKERVADALANLEGYR